jgi:hypothetical protein
MCCHSSESQTATWPHHASGRPLPSPDGLHLPLPQLLFLVAVAVALPAPEAEPQMWAGHPLTYATPYITYHDYTRSCVVNNSVEPEASCQPKLGTKCGDVPAWCACREVPSYNLVASTVCQNVFVGFRIPQQQCYPVQKLEVTTIIESVCQVSPLPGGPPVAPPNLSPDQGPPRVREVDRGLQ